MAKKFLKTLTNNIGFKILAVVFACMLWLVVYNIDDPTQTKTYTVHVALENEDAISDMSKYYEVLDGTNSVTFSVSAKRSIFNKIEDSDFSAVADMSKMVIGEDGSTGSVEIKISCSKYDSSLKYIGKSKYLLVGLEDLMSKQFVISPNTSGTVAKGYALGDVVISGSNVLKVSGPASVVNTISSVVATINVDGVSTSVSDNVLPTLYNVDGHEIDTTKLTLSMTTVNISATVLGTKEVPLNFDTTGTPREGYSVVGITPSIESVTLKGASSVLNTLTVLDIPSEVLNVEGRTDTMTTTVDITEYLPDGCQLVDKEEAVVSVSVQIEAYETRTYEVPVTAISVTGLADNRLLTYTGTTVEVELGGITSVLDSVDASSLQLVLDATNLSVGTHSVRLALKHSNTDYDLISAKTEVVIASNEDSNTGGNTTGDNSTGSTGGTTGTDTNTGSGSNSSGNGNSAGTGGNTESGTNTGTGTNTDTNE